MLSKRKQTKEIRTQKLLTNRKTERGTKTNAETQRNKEPNNKTVKKPKSKKEKQ